MSSDPLLVENTPASRPEDHEADDAELENQVRNLYKLDQSKPSCGERLRRRKLAVGLSILLLVAIGVGTFLTIDHFLNDGRTPDQRKTQDLYNKLSADVAEDGVVTLNTPLVGKDVDQLMTSSLGEGSLAISNAKVALQNSNDVDGDHKHVMLNGTARVLSQDVNVTAEMHYLDGRLRLFMRATVLKTVVPKPAPRRRGLKAPGDDIKNGYVSIPDLLPPGDCPPGYEDVFARSIELLFASERMEDPSTDRDIDAGLSMNGEIVPRDHPSPKYDPVVALNNGNDATQLNITGHLKPHVNLSVFTPFPINITLGEYVVLQNFSVSLQHKPDDMAIVKGALVITPPDLTSLIIDLAGTLDITSKFFTFQGAERGSWQLPGKVEGLSISAFAVNGTVSWANHTTFSGWASANVTYGRLSAELAFGLPPAAPKGGRGFALEAIVKDTFDMRSIAALNFIDPSKFPLLSVLNGLVVFSPYKGEYTFWNKNVPKPTMQVVHGLNLLVTLDMNSTGLIGLKRLQSESSSGVVIVGSIGEGRFNLSGSVSHLFVTSDVEFVDVKLAVSNVSPYVSLAAHLRIDGSVLASEDDVDFLVNGTFGDTVLDLAGNITEDWRVSIGSVQFDVNDIFFHLHNEQKVVKGNNTTVTAGQIGGFVDVTYHGQKHRYELLIAYPGPSSTALQKCFDFELKALSPITLGEVVSVFAPTTSKNYDVDSSLLNDILETSLTDLDFLFSPLCSNFTISASMHTTWFGVVKVGVNFHKKVCTKAPCAAAWQYSVLFLPSKDWKFSKSPLVPSSWPNFDLTAPIFALSSDYDSVVVPSANGMLFSQRPVSTVPGLNLWSSLLINQSAHMELLTELVPGVTELRMSGWFSKTGWSAAAGIPETSTLDFGRGISLSGSAINITVMFNVSTSLSLMGHLTAPNPLHSDQNIIFDAAVDIIEKDHQGSLKISGAVHNAEDSLSIDILQSKLTVKSLKVELRVGPSSDPKNKYSAVTGTLAGDMMIGSRSHFMISLSLLERGVLKLSGSLIEETPLTFGDMLTTLCGDSVWNVNLPQSVRNDIKNLWEFRSLSIDLTSDPLSFVGTGRMSIFKSVDLSAYVAVSKNKDPVSDSKFSYVFGVELTPGSAFSKVLPAVKSLDHMDLFDLTVVVSSFTTKFNFPNRTATTEVEPGFNFMAAVNFQGTDALDAVRRWTGVERALVKASIQSEQQFSVHADVAGKISPWPEVFAVTAAGLFFAVTPADAVVGMEIDTALNLTHRSQDHLTFHGDMFAGALGFGFDIAMTSDWNEPLGAKGLVISRADLSCEISWAVVPTMIGIAGGLHMGGVGGNVAIYISEKQQVLAGSFDNFNLQSMVDAILRDFGVTTPPTLVQVVTNVSFKRISVMFNDGPPIVFFGVTYPTGFAFEIQSLNLWDILKGSAKVVITGGNNAGLLVDALIQPINVLGGLIKIGGAHSFNDPLVFYIKIAAQSTPSINISAGMNIFGQYLATQVVLNDQRFSLLVNMSLIHNLFKFQLQCDVVGKISLPQDFSLSAQINNELQNYIENEIPRKIDQTKKDTDSKLEAVRRALAQKQADLNGLDRQIDALRAQDQAAISAAERKLQNAISDLNRAEEKVEELQHRINDLQHKIDSLPWYLKWEAVGYGTELAALWVAEKSAVGVLELCKLAVQAAKKVIPVAPNVDPRIVALEIARGTANAALDAAQAAVMAAEDIYNGIMDLVRGVSIWQGKIFNIEIFQLSGSLKQIYAGQLAHIRIKGTIIDKHIDINVDIDIKSIQSWISAIWAAIVHLFKHDKTRLHTNNYTTWVELHRRRISF